MNILFVGFAGCFEKIMPELRDLIYGALLHDATGGAKGVTVWGDESNPVEALAKTWALNYGHQFHNVPVKPTDRGFQHRTSILIDRMDLIVVIHPGGRDRNLDHMITVAKAKGVPVVIRDKSGFAFTPSSVQIRRFDELDNFTKFKFLNGSQINTKSVNNFGSFDTYIPQGLRDVRHINDTSAMVVVVR